MKLPSADGGHALAVELRHSGLGFQGSQAKAAQSRPAALSGLMHMGSSCLPARTAAAAHAMMLLAGACGEQSPAKNCAAPGAKTCCDH